jgi:hypothetical protein
LWITLFHRLGFKDYSYDLPFFSWPGIPGLVCTSQIIFPVHEKRIPGPYFTGFGTATRIGRATPAATTYGFSREYTKNAG